MSIHNFTDPTDYFHCFSNFCPCPVRLDGRLYTSAEHAYQAHSAIHYADFERIADAETPEDAKRLAHQLEPNRKKPGWISRHQRFDRMIEVQIAKFSLIKPYQDKLLETKSSDIVEYNTWHDDYWGAWLRDDGRVVGRNYHGRILMAIRGCLQVGVHIDTWRPTIVSQLPIPTIQLTDTDIWQIT